MATHIWKTLTKEQTQRKQQLAKQIPVKRLYYAKCLIFSIYDLISLLVDLFITESRTNRSSRDYDVKTPCSGDSKKTA